MIDDGFVRSGGMVLALRWFGVAIRESTVAMPFYFSFLVCKAKRSSARVRFVFVQRQYLLSSSEFLMVLFPELFCDAFNLLGRFSEGAKRMDGFCHAYLPASEGKIQYPLI